jgi:3-oxoacyl-[acyl-carrier-protein] synthase III
VTRPWLSKTALSVLGTGKALPGPAISSDDLINLVTERFSLSQGRAARAVARRMGIEHRHVCRPFDARQEPARAGHSNPELAAQAVRSALDDAGLKVEDIGYLIGHTTTPLQPLPSNISLVADLLDYSGPHAEFRQACTGFANGLVMATGLLAAPNAGPVVIVGSETGSLFFDPLRAAEDSGQLVNLVQMGDGAAAIVLGRATESNSQIKAAWFGSIGLGRSPGLQLKHGMTEFDHDFSAILATGSQLFDAGHDALAQLGVALDSGDYIIPHQVGGHIGAQLADHFKIDPGKAFVNANRVGNTGSAAIWLALAELREGNPPAGSRAIALGAEATKYMYGGFVYDHR